VLRELREANLPPGALAGAAPELAALLASYESALASLAGRKGGGTDRAGLARHAVRAAANVPPVRGVISYGAYELVGMNLDLLRSIPAEEGLTFLIPGDPETPASAYAVAWARRHLGAEPRRLPDLEPPRPFVAAATLVHDPESTGGGPLGPDDIHLVRVQGPEAELTFVARDILGKVAAGVAPDEIGVVARTLEPYAPLAETVFERHRLPVDASLSLPLLRNPRGQVLSLLVRALEEDFPRQVVLELVRSPAFHAPAGASEGWRPHRWDVWTRRHGVTRGLSSWHELPERLRNASRGPWSDDEEESLKEFRTRCEGEAASAELLVDRLEDMRREWDEAARSPHTADHARVLRRLAEEYIHRWGEPERGEHEVTRALETVLDHLERLEAVRESVPRSGPRAGGGTAAPGDASLAFVREALAEARLPWSEPGGLAFLDVMQARGLVFRHLYLIGFNADLFPIRRREDPFFPDALRRRLREATGRPLAVRDEGTDEEHLLLALTLAAAQETLTVTWQGADAAGRERPVSLWLRELARGMKDAPSLRALESGDAAVEPARVPTHPAEAARWYAERKPKGLASLEEAAVGTSHFASEGGVEALRDFLTEVDPASRERLRPALSLVSAVESFTAEALPFDGQLTSPPGHRHPLSATGLTMLGRCPLRFFFRYTLGVKPLEGAAREDRMHPRDLGIHVHKVLECVYHRLDEEGELRPGIGIEELRAAGRRALETEWERVVAPFAARLRERYPVLLEHSLTTWRGELERFLDADLARMAEDGHVLEGLELAWRETVPLEDEGGDPLTIEVWGFPDRVTRREDGVRHVSDYKTSGNLGKQVLAIENLRAHRPQLPLYLELAKARGDVPATAELLGIGPELEEEFRFADTGPVRYEPDELHAVEKGFPDTLAVLGGLPVRGLYPIHPDPYHCTWCEFRLACRQSHYASARRVEDHPAFASYFLTQKKSKSKPRLADVRAKDEGRRRGKRS